MTKKDPAAPAILQCSPIKVGPEYYHVKIIPKKDWTDGESYIGTLSFQDHEIRIRGDKQGHVLLDAVFHECLHAIWNQSLTRPFECWIGSNKVPTTPPITDVEEMVICAYEAGITTLFLDNPKLLDLCSYYWQPAARKRKE